MYAFGFCGTTFVKTAVDTSVLLDNAPLVKFIWNYIGDSSDMFSKTSRSEDINDFTDRYQVCLLIVLKFIGVHMMKTSSGLPSKSSEIFGNPWTSSEIFWNLQKIFGNICVTL